MSVLFFNVHTLDKLVLSNGLDFSHFYMVEVTFLLKVALENDFDKQVLSKGKHHIC